MTQRPSPATQPDFTDPISTILEKPVPVCSVQQAFHIYVIRTSNAKRAQPRWYAGRKQATRAAVWWRTHHVTPSDRPPRRLGDSDMFSRPRNAPPAGVEVRCGLPAVADGAGVEMTADARSSAAPHAPRMHAAHAAHHPGGLPASAPPRAPLPPHAPR